MDFLDLGEAAAAAVESQRAVAAEKRIELQYEAPKDPLLVKADFRATVQILDNFISNAVKFSTEGTQVDRQREEAKRRKRFWKCRIRGRD